MKLIVLKFSFHRVKGFRVIKNVKEIKFKGVRGELQSKKGFKENNSINISG